MIATFGEILDELSSGLIDFTENGKCSGCGNCCTNYLPMTEEEIEQIRSYIRKHGVRECNHRYRFLSDADFSIDMTCPFLDMTKGREKCVIYEARPAICREFICRKGSRFDKDKYPEKRMLVDVRGEFFG